MPLKPYPRYNSLPMKRYQIKNPGSGGLNMNDLEYELKENQSPYMMNMMYKKGTFRKRYGQELRDYFGLQSYEHISDFVYYSNCIVAIIVPILHATEVAWLTIESYNLETKENKILWNVVNDRNYDWKFIIYSNKLYLVRRKVNLEYNVDTLSLYEVNVNIEDYGLNEIEPYVPEVFFGAKPDGTQAEDGDEVNAISKLMKISYNPDGTAKKFYAYGKDLIYQVSGERVAKVEVDGVEVSNYTEFTDTTGFGVSFSTAPAQGTDSVVVTYILNDLPAEYYIMNLFSCYAVYGNGDNSRLFLGGFKDNFFVDGSESLKSVYFYSDKYDITYFPIFNYEQIGKGGDSITCFGLQYNTLFIFKPNEIYSISTYTQTFATTSDEETVGEEAFRTQLVNASIGCTNQETMQLINNRLTWFNSKIGVCTLSSTNIIDERNVQVISQNVNRANIFGIKGMLELGDATCSADFEGKYILCFAKEEAGLSDYAFVWDYDLTPFVSNNTKETNASELAWFVFDNIRAIKFLNAGNRLFYNRWPDTTVQEESRDDPWPTPVYPYNTNLVELTDSLSDKIYDEDETPKGINAYYMTPFIEFDAIDYLKNVKNIYVQCRGETSSVIDMYYYTDESITRQQEPDAIVFGGKIKESESISLGGRIWEHFSWDNFEWLIVNWANTFRRKCSLKKIQMCSFYFENIDKEESGEVISVAGRDMSITGISMDYQLIKNVK